MPLLTILVSKGFLPIVVRAHAVKIPLAPVLNDDVLGIAFAYREEKKERVSQFDNFELKNEWEGRFVFQEAVVVVVVVINIPSTQTFHLRSFEW